MQDAIEKSSEFVDRYSGEPVAAKARVTMADACIEFGNFLNEELELAREENPDKVAGLEEEAAAIFRKGVEAAKNSEVAFKNEGNKIEQFVAMLRRGILIREHARAVPKDRTYPVRRGIGRVRGAHPRGR
ncbi:MAG: hypothetical protein H6837_13280 [Planctomycetes bacterium]|nr:hypothetical protein [Planctomycetota bacterium]